MVRPCCTCSAESARYRCPRCRLQYCSVGCCKKHKETCLPKEEKEAHSSSSFPDVMSTRGDLLGENDESDAISLQKLLLLGKSEELKGLLLNTHLRQLLVTLDQTEGKGQELKTYMQEPLFVEFADRCLSLVEAEGKENLYPKC
ncbi:zinc finger HIT domain-containing protein 3 [Bufo gargarizans]|uniref:zinc finger HIT domain-containing protein 3 n=1 Tax=Bufo gargarizans TaxID=30331 RepID=UPI001CF2F210|nr:zinc finger HIT domain-containing protein 3 [Bufo gargarizans]